MDIDVLPPPGVWPLPSSIDCTEAPAAAGAALSAGLQLVASGAGSATDVTTAALARYKPLLLGGSTTDATGAVAGPTVKTIKVDVWAPEFGGRNGYLRTWPSQTGRLVLVGNLWYMYTPNKET